MPLLRTLCVFSLFGYDQKFTFQIYSSSTNKSVEIQLTATLISTKAKNILGFFLIKDLFCSIGKLKMSELPLCFQNLTGTGGREAVNWNSTDSFTFQNLEFFWQNWMIPTLQAKVFFFSPGTSTSNTWSYRYGSSEGSQKGPLAKGFLEHVLCPIDEKLHRFWHFISKHLPRTKKKRLLLFSITWKGRIKLISIALLALHNTSSNTLNLNELLI